MKIAKLAKEILNAQNVKMKDTKVKIVLKVVLLVQKQVVMFKVIVKNLNAEILLMV